MSGVFARLATPMVGRATLRAVALLVGYLGFASEEAATGILFDPYLEPVLLLTLSEGWFYLEKYLRKKEKA